MKPRLYLLAVALLAANAWALPYLRPDGAGGTLNAYERLGSTATWPAAYTAAQARLYAGLAGHLVTIADGSENSFVRNRMGTGWLGLTDDAAYGGSEFGDTHTLAYPPPGQTPSETPGTQRGEGWVWVTGERLVYQNWNGSEPNNAGGENFAELTGGGGWNDLPATYTRNPIVEWENPAAWPRYFKIRDIKAAAGVDLTNLAQGELLLAGALPAASETRLAAPLVNFLGDGAGAHFTGAGSSETGLPDPTVLNQYVLYAQGFVNIPAPGQWTFGVNSDDGFRLTILGAITSSVTNSSTPAGSDTISYFNPRGPSDTLGVFNFPAAGPYNLELLFFERGGGDEVEFYAAPGSFSAWGDTTAWTLVGDYRNGGLVVTQPEPTTLALLALGGLGLLVRRRRR